jgi:hypothetical protein
MICPEGCKEPMHKEPVYPESMVGGGYLNTCFSCGRQVLTDLVGTIKTTSE